MIKTLQTIVIIITINIDYYNYYNYYYYNISTNFCLFAFFTESEPIQIIAAYKIAASDEAALWVTKFGIESCNVLTEEITDAQKFNFAAKFPSNWGFLALRFFVFASQFSDKKRIFRQDKIQVKEIEILSAAFLLHATYNT